MLLNFSATTEDFVPLSLETVSSEPAVKPVSQTSRRKTTQPQRRTTKVVETKQAPLPKAVVKTKPIPKVVPKTAPSPIVVGIPPNASVELAESMADDPNSRVTTRMFREWYEAHALKTPRQKKAFVPTSSWEVVNGRGKHTLKGEKRATSKAGETVDRILKRMDPAEFAFVVQQLTAELSGSGPISTEIIAGRGGKDYEKTTYGEVNIPSDETRQKEMFDRLATAQLVVELMQKAGLVS
jgi:hypothetical protein